MENDWAYFKDWTLSLIQNLGTLKAEVMVKLDEAHHRLREDPRTFHAHLDTLEKHFPRLREEERALAFFSKLHKPLRTTIYDSSGQVR
jgi:hypothetical protein